jgi:lysophospholipase L1-like esterase
MGSHRSALADGGPSWVRRRRLPLTLVLTVTAGLVLALPGLSWARSVVAAQAAAARPAAVVALGDSFISGEGAGHYSPNTDRSGNLCHRSAGAAVARLGVPGVAPAHRFNLACSGATVGNVRLGGAARYGEGAQADRLRAVARDYRVRLVVLTVGINDLGYGELAKSCVLAYLHLAPPCRQVWAPRIAAKLPAVQAGVARDVADIRTVLRDAGYADGDYSFVLQSYASPMTGDIRYGLTRVLHGCPLRDEDGEWARNQLVPQLGAMYARVAAAQGVRLLDLAPALRGREACARGITSGQEWANGISLQLGRALRANWPKYGVSVVASAHPNAAGQAQFARCLTAFAATTARAARCVRGPDGNLTPVPTT